MPDREVTMGSSTDTVNPLEQWLRKWFGGGAFGSAAWSPQRWPVPPGATASYWGVPSTTPETTGEEEPEIWELLQYPSEESYLKVKPWKDLGVSRTEFERVTRGEKKQKWEERAKAIAPTVPDQNKPMTYEEAQTMRVKLGAGYYIDYDEDIGGYRVERDPRYFAPPETVSPYQEEQLKLQRGEAGRKEAESASDLEYRKLQLELQKGEASRKERESASDLEYRKLQLESEKLYRQQTIDLQKQEMAQQKANQQAMLDWYQTQAMVQQQEAERQEGARLLANPQSWLQYNAYTGQTPTVQPWMRPLMEQQYKIGEAIPGWQGQQGGVTGQPMNTLQGLRTPSAQLWARMGPTAQSQYMGYEQARTGSHPEETAFRLRAGAPPSGGYAGLRWMR